MKRHEEKIENLIPGKTDFSLEKLIFEINAAEVRKNPFPKDVTEWTRQYQVTFTLDNYTIHLIASKDLAFPDKSNQYGNRPNIIERAKSLVFGSYGAIGFLYEKKKFSQAYRSKYSSILYFDDKTCRKIYSDLENTYKNPDREIKHCWLFL
ncbi:hypothetical protein JW756_01835 [Candidatus Woesearchaeota archaeon]|nr:hypothetical protein [Candidatus Woesearchaeota archaeon]